MAVEFPAFLKLEHQAGNASQSLLAEINGALEPAERRFAEFSREAERQIDQVFKSRRTSGGALDLDVSGMRAAAAAAEERARAAREVAFATQLAARAQDDNSQSTRLAIAATQAAAREAEGAASAARTHAAAIEQVQAQLNRFASQSRVVTAEYLGLARAETAAAEGARLIAAIYRGTSDEMGQAANSARESAQAFDLLFQAQDARSSVAGQSFFNAALGIDAQTKSARESARAFEEMFAAQQLADTATKEMAAGAAQLRAQLDPMFAAQQRFDQELARADQLLEAGAISTREYAAAQQLARNNLREAAQAATQSNDAIARSARIGTTAQSNVINSSRASRVAFIQLGQQMQDVTIQAQMGTNAFQIFAQQVPQAAFALSGLRDSANKTQATIGRFATFMSGPWGAALFAATAVLGPLIYRLTQTEEATEAAEFATYQFSDAQGILGSIIDLTTGKINTQSEALIALARAQAIAGQIKARSEQAEAAGLLDEIQRGRTQRSNRVPIGGAGMYGSGFAYETVDTPAGQIVETFRTGGLAMDTAIDRLDQLQDRGAITEQQFLDAATALTQFGVAGENLKVFEELEKALVGDREALQGFLRPERERSARTPRTPRDTSARDAERLADFGERAAEQIARVNERFDEQPRLIDQAARATRELDSIIAELSERKPVGFEQMIEQANAAKDVIEDALVRPLRDAREESERRQQIDSLLLSGREEEAAALEAIWRLEDQLGTEEELRLQVQNLITQGRQEEADILQRLLSLYPSIKREMADIAAADVARLEAMDRLYEQQNTYLNATRELRSELENMFAGESFDFEKIGRQLQSRLSVERIFGDALREIEDQVKDSYGTAVDTLEEQNLRAAEAVAYMADAAIYAGNRMVNPTLGTAGAPIAPAANDDTIVVTGERDRNSIGGMSPSEYFDMVGRKLVEPLLFGLDEVIGVTMVDRLSGILGTAAGGYLGAGPVGAGLGLFKGLNAEFGESLFGRDFATTIGSHLGGALQGAMQGAQIASIFGGSRTGGALGGAAGSLIGGPVGNIIGSIIGGIAGDLLGGILGGRSAGAIITNGNVSTFGGSKGNYGEANKLAGAVNESLDEIAEALGVTVGNFRLTIGLFEDEIRLNRSGGDTLKGSGVQSFGQDADAAIRAAIADAIKDGAIRLNAQETRLFNGNSDIDKAIADVLRFREVLGEIGAVGDPLGAEIDALNREFEDLIDLFDRAGATTQQYTQLEAAYNEERARLIEEANERISGSLKELIADLTIGDSGLSLRDRRANALTQYDELAERVRAGDTGAFDEFAEVARELLGIEREIFGSQQGYFDRFNEVRDISQAAVDEQERALAEAANRDSPFGSGGAAGDTGLIAAVDRGNTAIVDQLIALNDNFSRFGSLVGGTGNRNATQHVGRMPFAGNW